MSIFRNVYIGDINDTYLDKEIIVAGWVHSKRNHGGIVFLNIRDVSGVLQTVVYEESQEIYAQAKTLREESVVSIVGVLKNRPQELINPNMKTGKYELLIKDLKILSEAEPLPVQLNEFQDASNDLKLKYRYLEMRLTNIGEKIRLRASVAHFIREYLYAHKYNEVETPLLMKSTPEGARDFLVPSRLYHGKFYALPQSPQTLKQILMVAGFDKYYQFARCFRDEDLRQDRQPEFTQIDIEVSFMDKEDLILEVEDLLKKVWKEFKGVDFGQERFPVLSYNDAVFNYGVDKPDMRFGLLLSDYTEVFRNSSFNVFRNIVQGGGSVRGLVIPHLVSRKEVDLSVEVVKYFGFNNIGWCKLEKGEFTGGISKFLNDDEKDSLIKDVEDKLANYEEYTKNKGASVLFLAGDNFERVSEALGELRLFWGERLGLIPEDKHSFVWIVDFPLFEYSKEEKRLIAKHHPFTRPVDEDKEILLNSSKIEELLKIRAASYDIVYNGVELGGGSLRIYEPELQMAMFKALGFSNEQAQAQFGFLINAFKYGVPPHGGIALGFDRLMMLVTNADSIKDVIAFPKTNKALDLMLDAPSEVAQKQLDELGLIIKKNE